MPLPEFSRFLPGAERKKYLAAVRSRIEQERGVELLTNLAKELIEHGDHSATVMEKNGHGYLLTMRFNLERPLNIQMPLSKGIALEPGTRKVFVRFTGIMNS